MKIVIPNTIAKQIQGSLKTAGSKEIGGVLMGEYISDGIFGVKEITIQPNYGTFASFIRKVQSMLRPLKDFFRKTDEQYTRFNYLGEWHSHPSFEPVPSQTDHRTMQDIVEDKEVGANFVVLLVVKLDKTGQLLATAHIYGRGSSVSQGMLIWEESHGV